jgi:hypothetical protein
VRPSSPSIQTVSETPRTSARNTVSLHPEIPYIFMSDFYVFDILITLQIGWN